MNTKKTYVVPTMLVVKVETASFLAASPLNVGGTIGGRDGIMDPGDVDETP